MKNKVISIITLLTFCLAFTMCSESEEISDIAMFISPGSDVETTLYSGENALFQIHVVASHEKIASLKITSFDAQNGQILCADLKCDGTTFDYDYVYTAPELKREEGEVTLTFTAKDTAGNIVILKRSILLKNQKVTTAEKTGIVLYSPHSNKPDALNLEAVTLPFNLADSPTPEKADIYIKMGLDGVKIDWVSNTNRKFLRYNQFNYAEATASSISSVYKNSLLSDNVSDIKANDIIIVGHDDVAEGVFFVTNIIRSEGKFDCMQLNFKGIVVPIKDPSEPENPGVSE